LNNTEHHLVLNIIEFKNKHNNTFKKMSEAIMLKALKRLLHLGSGYTIFLHDLGTDRRSVLILRPLV
jgi:hypothetical protein